ncbi:Armadillo-like helical-containing protein [Dioscorea alata]|uniref:Armadillo-like helical-containing protein n=1 Tax=Dioscorea alata TaxID=55571 RepID=A0ACB7V151_DIOAL|nr:Armadillo-like helical-containing protein [Dioscorea alata]
MKQLLSGNGEAELDPNQVSQVAVEVCKDDLLSLFVLKLPTLGWQRNRQLVGPTRLPRACTSLGGASGSGARSHVGGGTTCAQPPLTTPRNVLSPENRTLTTR